MADTRPTPRLTSDEVALVLRRAVEIEAQTDVDLESTGWDPAALEAAAEEVGLSSAAVRQAVAELRAGALLVPDDAAGRRRRRGPGGLPEPVTGSRAVVQQRLVVPPPDRVTAKVDRFLRTQMFELGRRSGDRAIYRPRRDMVASLRRGLDFAGAIRLDGLRTVTTVVTPADDRTLVRIEAELAASRANAVSVGVAAGASVSFVTGLLGALFGDPALVIAALPAGAVVGGGGVRITESRWRRRRNDVSEALDRLLDTLK